MIKNPRILPNLPRPTLTRPVELLTFPQVQVLDVTGPLQVFATANDIAGNKAPPYAIRVVSQAGGAVVSSSGMGLLTHPLQFRGGHADRRWRPGDRGSGGR